MNQHGTSVSDISAALILADKSDVHRERVRNTNISKFDKHDKVNYAVTNTEFIVNRYRSIKNKLAYYKRTYGENLVHNKVPSIKILSAGYGNADLWEDKNNG